MNKKSRNIFIYIGVFAALIIAFMVMVNSLPRGGTTIKYYKVLEYFQQGKVTECTLDLGSGALTAKIEGQEEQLYYQVPNVSLFVQAVEPIILEHLSLIHI